MRINRTAKSKKYSCELRKWTPATYATSWQWKVQMAYAMPGPTSPTHLPNDRTQFVMSQNNKKNANKNASRNFASQPRRIRNQSRFINDTLEVKVPYVVMWNVTYGIFYAVYAGVGRVTNKSTKGTKSWRNGNVNRQSAAEASELHKFIGVTIECKRQVRTRRQSTPCAGIALQFLRIVVIRVRRD